MSLRYTRAMKRTTIWLNEKDKGAIKKIQEMYGLGSGSAAIRFALRVLAAQEIKIDVTSTQDTAKSDS